LNNTSDSQFRKTLGLGPQLGEKRPVVEGKRNCCGFASLKRSQGGAGNGEAAHMVEVKVASLSPKVVRRVKKKKNCGRMSEAVDKVSPLFATTAHRIYLPRRKGKRKNGILFRQDLWPRKKVDFHPKSSR